MGMERVVSFAGTPLAWPIVAEHLAGQGMVVQMRMIDGELAFPDETPPESWRELRVAWSGAMVTVRRGGEVVSVVAWGNADETQRQLWQAVTSALVSAGGKLVEPTG